MAKPRELTHCEKQGLRPRGKEVVMPKLTTYPQKYHPFQNLSSKEELLLNQYKTRVRIPADRMRAVADGLSQGEKDVLGQVRAALTWSTVLSLAYKYYPLYPHRKWWLAALRRAQKYARFVNIRYLLLTLRSIRLEKEAERQKTMEGLSIDTTLTSSRDYQLIQTNERRLEARQLAKLALAAEGGVVG